MTRTKHISEHSLILTLTPLYANSIESNDDARETNERFQFVLLRYCGSRDVSYLSRAHDDGAVTQCNDERRLRLANHDVALKTSAQRNKQEKI